MINQDACPHCKTVINLTTERYQGLQLADSWRQKCTTCGKPFSVNLNPFGAPIAIKAECRETNRHCLEMFETLGSLDSLETFYRCVNCGSMAKTFF